MVNAIQPQPPGGRLTRAHILELQAFVAALEPEPGKRTELLWFERKSGFGVRVSKSHAAYVAQLPVAGHKRPWRWTLPQPFPMLDVDTARRMVAALALKIAAGFDPFAERAREQAQAEADARQRENDRFTLGALVDLWEREHLRRHRRASYAGNASASVRNHFETLLDRPAATLTKADVKDALKDAKGARVAGAGLRAAYSWALREDHLSVDPLNGWKPPAAQKSRDRVLEIGELRRIWAAAEGLRYPGSEFVRLLMLTGCRRCEISGLRWDEIKPDGDDGFCIELATERTKTGAGHHVPLSDEALAIVRSCPKMLGVPYVLSSGRRPFVSFARLKDAIDDALDRDGGPPLKAWRFHDFRRSIVTLLSRKPFRKNPHALDQLLGHAPRNLDPIARVYNREEYADLRREALADWAAYVTASGDVCRLDQRRKSA
jgi:integrase